MGYFNSGREKFSYSKLFGLQVFLLSLVVSVVFVQRTDAQQYNLGIGVYPGNPQENFSPSMRIDSSNYRNLALLRPAYQSSSYDFNLTAQLVTDGIIDHKLPGWIVTTTSSDGVLPLTSREFVLDRHGTSRQDFKGPHAWLEVKMAGDYDIPPVDSLNLSGSVTLDTLLNAPWEVSVSGSNNGKKWDKLGSASSDTLPGLDALTQMLKRFPLPAGRKLTAQQMRFFRRFAPRTRRDLNYGFKLSSPVHYRYYRFDVSDPYAKNWSIGDFEFLNKGDFAPIGGPYHFTSAWKSAGNQREWVYVDLGAPCTFNRVKLYWIRRASAGKIQISNDTKTWNDVAPIPDNTSNTDDIKLGKQVTARYVRVLMTKASSPSDGYILSEFEVWGTGGPVPVAHVQKPIGKNDRLDLAGGAWRLQRSSLVNSDGTQLSEPGYNDSQWPIATVPATILTSYLNDGAVPDPNYGENMMNVSDSYFYSDFWYRDVFTAPASYNGKRMYLNFDGINWKAEVYLNGHDLGQIDGAFIRGKFDVTDVLKPGQKNVLAVRIIKNDIPGYPTQQDSVNTDANGGELGADNPTFHASIGWDWIPTIRGRDTGIWNDVYLTQSGPVTIENPFVSSKLPLPDTTSADIHIEVTLHNHSDHAVNGTFKGTFGTIAFEQPVKLDANESKTVTLDPSTNPSLKLHDPKLWWPNGYGKQNLYDVNMEFMTNDGKPSDSKSFKTGVRQMTYSEDGGALKIWVNGKRFIARGGNWGFSEDLLRYRSREYNIAVRYHKEMNFTMIRNWVGQTDDDEFYQACDKYGIMVWQDFWLANPVDGPNPKYPDMFINNLKDYIKRIRNHPSIALFVGRNEGNPPPVIQKGIDEWLPKLDPGIKYIPNSAFGTVSGGGPYRLMPLKYYFQNRATPKLHSEMGMPDVVSYQSLKRMMPDSSVWPRSNTWGVHDFTLHGAQSGDSFNKSIEDHFGKVNNMKQWLSLAYWTEYRGYRAMFEAQSKNRMGLLIWMSHPSWPSLTWQTYDYYFEPTASYFGSKEGSEPLHIQWNPLTDSVEVVNYSVANGANLTATMKIMNMDGTVKVSKIATVTCPEDHTARVFSVTITPSVSPIYFIRLELKRGSHVISRNFYWQSKKEGDLRGILNVPDVLLTSNTSAVHEGDRWVLETRLSNHSRYPAFVVRLNVVGNQTGKQILPVIYSDNYLTLLPGDQRVIKITLNNADTRGERPVVKVTGLNVKEWGF